MIERALNYIRTKLTPEEPKKPERNYRSINHKEAYRIHLEQQSFTDKVARNRYKSEINPSTTLSNPSEKMRLPGEVKPIHTEPIEHEVYP